jgi:sigma-B regulation protein RsbU (phosphoserine phosphatase)
MGFFSHQLLSLGSEGIGIVVGDVSGHGIGSALLMSTARALLRLRSIQSVTLSDIVNDVNRELSNDVGDSGQFMTLFYMSIEQSTRSVRWVRAGHDPAIFYDSQNDTFDELKGPGIPLGVDADWRYGDEVKRDLPKNQNILIGTDGIWEAQNAEGEMFGKAPIYAIIRQYASECSHQILKCIVDELNRFQNGYQSTDDVALVVIKT